MNDTVTPAPAPAAPAPVSAPAPAPAPAAPAAAPQKYVAILEADYNKLKAAAATWIDKQESWVKKNWLALVGHLSTIGTVVSAWIKGHLP
jgi:hypothetical protein